MAAGCARARRGGVPLHYQPIFDVRRARGRRRGAAALARPGARRPGPAERVHPGGRGDRADRVDRRLGHRRRLRPAGRLGGARPDAADLGQRLAAPAAPRRLHPARHRAPAPHRRRPGRLTVELTESAMQQDPPTPSRSCASCTSSASSSRSTTSAPATPRCPACARCRWRRSRSTARSCARCPRAARRRDRHRDPRLARALGAPRSPRASRPRRSARFLAEQRCPLLQGFLLARPMPPAEVEALLAGERRARRG